MSNPVFDRLWFWEAALVLLLVCSSVTCTDCDVLAAVRSRVVPGELCDIQHAIRWRNAAWSDAYCGRVAGALNRSRDPLLLEAVCINESDLREDVVTVVRPGIYDVGLCGVRCVLDSGEGRGGRCRNGPASGHTLRQLLDGPTNVRLADEILHETHGGSLREFNGGTRDHGSEGRVGAVREALGGQDVFEGARGGSVRETRMRKLTRQILGVVRRHRS